MSWILLVGFLSGLADSSMLNLACRFDGHEPNDSRRRAEIVERGTVLASACFGDVDWYRVYLKRGDRLQFEVFAPRGAVNLKLYPPRARRPRGHYRATSQKTTLTYRARKAGNHRIRLEGPQESLAYRLEVAIKDD